MQDSGCESGKCNTASVAIFDRYHYHYRKIFKTPHFRSSNKPKIVLTWAPHVKPLPQCVANSFSQWINAWGKADFVITHPEDYELR